MNPLLQVKLRFSKERNTQKPAARNLRAHAETSVEKIYGLIESLKAVRRFYSDAPKILDNMLIDVNYNDIIAKSNRIHDLLKPMGKSTNDIVVGARFSDASEGEENHIITYYVDSATVERTLSELEIVSAFLSEKFGGKATPQNFNEPGASVNYNGWNLSKSKIRNIIVDCSVIESFSIPAISTTPDQETFLITFFKTELPVSSILEKLNIDNIHYQYSFYGEYTISATKDLYQILNDQVPYLISMISVDLSKITLGDINERHDLPHVNIPDPTNEPVIGVIDTLFDENVYFNQWVENVDYLDELERYAARNDPREHGTEVTSILVDGPRLNPWLEDHCGRFRVKHFGVCTEKISISRLVRKIKEIVIRNPNIHVWNLSLGTEDEVSKNFISYDAAVLDELQAQRNVIFVVSGTNDNRAEQVGILKVGSPADSLNAVVVNSVKRNGTPASYSRKGNVLSFFTKPDIAYFGGDYDERIIAYSPLSGEEPVYGTSFAAPWISRKLCYLIDVLGFSREVAKALLIDSAAGWEYKRSTYRNRDVVGYGIVPIDINNILSTENDEIRFVVYGTSESYKTTNYAIPVPRDEDGKYPYVARATMCYFPRCTRSQGVDYTDRELSLKFGRINAKGVIDDINDNIQDESDSHVDERTSRREFRKWENTKFISRVVNNNRPLKAYDERLWGIAITSKERLSTRTGLKLNFGAVITLKEINSVNRINDFIRACNLRGWIVNEINVQTQLEIYNANQEELQFE